MGDDWIDKRVDAAKAAHPVADQVASAVKEQLRGGMSDRALRPAELSSLAKNLLSCAADPPAGVQ